MRLIKPPTHLLKVPVQSLYASIRGKVTFCFPISKALIRISKYSKTALELSQYQAVKCFEQIQNNKPEYRALIGKMSSGDGLRLVVNGDAFVQLTEMLSLCMLSFGFHD